jgi:predicted dehydrogenase/threonine dehydrogenase-like Zn-dependent dehydrogenase
MKQVLQNLKNGQTIIAEIPAPKNTKGNILISSSVSLISAGTEKMLIDFGKSSYLEKAKKQPDKVKQVFDKIKSDGLLPTVEAVTSKLNQPLPLGYCNVGKVLESSDRQFLKGDRVVSNGPHAEIVRVPINLCAKIPDNVDDETASFTVLGAIALQSIRLANPSLGETFIVSGLGSVGLLSVQILLANGCRVIGLDFNADRCNLAKSFGAEVVNLSNDEDPESFVSKFTNSNGVDGVIIAAASLSDEIIHSAANMCRKRARIILVGVVGLNLRRDDFFEKEITFQVSFSYGPGRNEKSYEEKGIDYPIGFVRWTEQRNFEAVLNLMSSGKLNVKPLISNTFSIEEAVRAYETILDPNISSMGVLLKYHSANSDDIKNTIDLRQSVRKNYELDTDVNIGFLGAGNYASRVLIPIFTKHKVLMNTLVTSGGINSYFHGSKNGFVNASTDENSVMQNDEINTVVIATRHDNHAKQISMALNKNKNVFVEKPLAITRQQILEIEKAYTSNTKNILMVGFNRRFAPHIVKMKSLLLKKNAPKNIVINVNAGFIESSHWTQDIKIGGGRIIGEACHFIDLLLFLIDSKVKSFKALGANNLDSPCDNVTISILFEDGSLGVVHYFSNGPKNFSKEKIDVFCDGSALCIDNFIKMRGYNWKGFSKMNLLAQNKGNKECVTEFVSSIKSSSPSPISFEDIIDGAKLLLDVVESLNR